MGGFACARVAGRAYLSAMTEPIQISPVAPAVQPVVAAAPTPAAPTPAAPPPAVAPPAPVVDIAAYEALKAKVASGEQARKVLEASLADAAKNDPSVEMALLKSRVTAAELSQKRSIIEAAVMRVAMRSDVADAEDLVLALSDKVDVAADGKVNEVALRASVEDILKSKPHWRRPAAIAHGAQSAPPLPVSATVVSQPASVNVVYSEADLYKMPLSELRKVRTAHALKM